MRKVNRVFLTLMSVVGLLLIVNTMSKASESLRQVTTGKKKVAPRRGSSQQGDELSHPAKSTAQAGSAEPAPEIETTNLISIPFGIQPVLPLGSGGESVQVRGHGGCTEHEQVTVEITITQSIISAAATGEAEETCTGKLQHWNLAVTTSTPLTAGPAEACGLATTHLADEVTDSYTWCRDVTLDWERLLPLVTYQAGPSKG